MNIIMGTYNIHQALFAKRRKPCKGRKRSSCKTAKKRCIWAHGCSKRAFCRKINSTRRRLSK